MRGGVMVTDGGPHSAEKWAVTTGEHIFPLDDKLVGARLIAAKRVQLQIIEALMPHHEENMRDECSGLSQHGDARLSHPYEPERHAEAALQAVCASLSGTAWQDRAADPVWIATVRRELESHFATAQNIERQWHCRRNPSGTAKAWLDRHHPVSEVEA